MILRHRDQLGLWLNELGLMELAAEIGCAFGGFAKLFLNQWLGQKYLMIDPWSRQDTDVYRERQESEQHYELWYKECRELAKSDSRISLLRMDSVNASKQCADACLDFVYIDGNHSFEAVTEDLNAWWPKLKIGGIMAGHDFGTKKDEGWYCEVDRAVEVWAKERQLPVAITTCPGFWIQKNKL